MRGKRKSGRIALIILVLSLVLFGILSYRAVAPYIAAEIQMQDVTSEAAEDTSLIDWGYWLSINPDIVGWIVVPGTNIDYPIVQAPQDDPSFYLDHDVYKEYNIYGCPYVDADCKGLDDPAPVIYGHNMINNTMFTAFSNMVYADYADEHSEIIIMTPDETRKTETIAANVINANVNEKHTGFTVNGMRKHFDKSISECQMQRMAFPADAKRTYTFVTCSYTTFSNERTLVYSIDKEVIK